MACECGCRSGDFVPQEGDVGQHVEQRDERDLNRRLADLERRLSELESAASPR